MISSETSPEFEALLTHLKHKQGCDLTGYKRSSLIRRFRRRMEEINIDNYQSYLQYLEYQPEEYLALLDQVLINVTSFFRDRDAWDYLATHIIPKIIDNKQPDEPIRVWSAGCASGQEIYSLLMLLAEALGIESCLRRVQCYATDVDESALKQARQGTYSTEDITHLPPQLLEKYFRASEQGYTFHSSLRRKIIFGQHNLTKDAPMSKIDLLMCRNVLIYFNLETQTSILTRFHFALKSTGFLFLGKAETLINHRPVFTPIGQQHIYTKGLKLELAEHLAITPQTSKQRSPEPSTTHNRFWQASFANSPVAQLAVSLNGFLIGANQQANRLFKLTPDDWNRPFQELEPGKLVGSQAFMARFHHNQNTITLKNIEWSHSKTTKYFDIAIAPVYDPQKRLLGITVTFLDKTNYQRLRRELKNTHTELKRVSQSCQETYTELEAAYQEIDLLIQDTPES